MRYVNIRALVQLCLSLLLLWIPGLAVAETVELVRENGVFMVPVRINDAVTIPFVLDSGAGDVSVPEDVFKTLLRTRTVTESDFREPGLFVTADGSQHLKQRFILHELRVGDRVVNDVVASVAPDKADPLLGQSFLGTLPRWAIDNTRHALVIGADGEGEGERAQAAIPVPPPADPAPTKPPALSDGVAAYQRGDYVTAVSIFRSLADQGLADAQNNLGSLYANGEGVTQNYAEAARWYRKAADQGHANAQTNLGFLYSEGQGVTQNYAEAARWYRKAADQGNVVAMFDVAKSYDKGQGVERNDASAAHWYLQAAEKGDAESMNSIGIMYAMGQGVTKNCALAKQWLDKAVAAGSSTAPFNLRNWKCQ